MAVAIGNSWVSQEAYDYVKKQDFNKVEADTNSAKTNTNALLSELADKYKNLKFGGTEGLNNVSIDPNILQKMANDPKAREEYEALLYDMNELAKNPLKTNLLGGEITASGFIINADGSTGGWSVSRSKSESSEKSYIQKLLEELEKIRKEREMSKGKQEISMTFTLNVKA